jgi:hypothetical protein
LHFMKGCFGLKVGPRPQLTFQGVWFYAGQTPIVHVISDRPVESGKTGAFDNIAFAMDVSPTEMEKSLNGHGIPFQSRLIERTGIYHIACKDPDGCDVELNFHGVSSSTPR